MFASPIESIESKNFPKAPIISWASRPVSTAPFIALYAAPAVCSANAISIINHCFQTEAYVGLLLLLSASALLTVLALVQVDKVCYN